MSIENSAAAATKEAKTAATKEAKTEVAKAAQGFFSWRIFFRK